MNAIRVISEAEGVRTVTDGKSTWTEYPQSKRGVIRWFEQEVLFHPVTWYTKTLAFVFDWVFMLPLLIPAYQATLIYYVSPYIGLGGWEWWQIVIKGILLGILWIPSVLLSMWAGQCSVGENGFDAAED